jgi:F0F1-type ATP synthase assembly protein I
VPPDQQDRGTGGAGDWTRAVREAGPYLSLGATLATTVLLGVGAGYWIDRIWGTAPVFLLVGGTLGVVTALYEFVKTASRKP